MVMDYLAIANTATALRRLDWRTRLPEGVVDLQKIENLNFFHKSESIKNSILNPEKRHFEPVGLDDPMRGDEMEDDAVEQQDRAAGHDGHEKREPGRTQQLMHRQRPDVNKITNY